MDGLRVARPGAFADRLAAIWLVIYGCRVPTCTQAGEGSRERLRNLRNVMRTLRPSQSGQGRSDRHKWSRFLLA